MRVGLIDSKITIYKWFIFVDRGYNISFVIEYSYKLDGQTIILSVYLKHRIRLSVPIHSDRYDGAWEFSRGRQMAVSQKDQQCTFGGRTVCCWHRRCRRIP